MLNDFLSKFHIQRGHEPTVISLGQVWVDIMMDVPEIPVAGDFISSRHVSRSVSGSFRVMQAASHMGAHVLNAGVMGTGHWATYINDKFRQAHISSIGKVDPNYDNGFRIVLNDGSAKTFIASHGAEIHGKPQMFDHVRPQESDVVYIAGNALMNEGAIGVNEFIQRPECSPDQRTFKIVINPTSSLHLVSDQLIEHLVLARPIWSLNRQEARMLATKLGIDHDHPKTLTVGGGFDDSMYELCRALGDVLHSTVILRAGSRGAWVKRKNRDVTHVEGFSTKATHIRSAGPCHTGALCALLAESWDVEDAVQIANAAASIAILRNQHGVPVCPGFEEATALAATAIERHATAEQAERLEAALKKTDVRKAAKGSGSAKEAKGSGAAGRAAAAGVASAAGASSGAAEKDSAAE